jgi:hypothetical protein
MELLGFIIRVLLVATIVGGVIFVITKIQIGNHKQGIVNYLRGLGATNISIAVEGGDKSNYRYLVRYVDAQGVACQTYCKMGVGLASDGVIYWEETPR